MAMTSSLIMAVTSQWRLMRTTSQLHRCRTSPMVPDAERCNAEKGKGKAKIEAEISPGNDFGRRDRIEIISDIARGVSRPAERKYRGEAKHVVGLGPHDSRRCDFVGILGER
jgi:hypothetical protein